jgi:pimeloyl-ACP methyl ester carboxylesterase
MPFVKAGEVNLNYVEHGSGDNIIVFIHGNLACVNWMDLVWSKLPENLHVYGIDWRGCGESDKPETTEDYSNYSMKQHATDMINAINALGIKKCHLANHSTGGIICTNMLLMEPEMFGKVFCLDPVGPMGLDLEGNVEFFKAMKSSRDVTYAAMATAAPSLFIPESLQPNNMPQFAENTTEEQKKLYELIIDKTMQVSDGIWLGTPVNLTKDYKSGELRAKQPEINHRHLILWGEFDFWIPKADVEEMAEKMPNCELQIISGVGHSLNVEDPERFAKIFTEFFSK